MAASLGNSMHQAFFGIRVGSLVSLWITLQTVALNPSQQAQFMALTWSAALASVYFEVMSAIGYFRSQKTLRRLKKRP